MRDRLAQFMSDNRQHMQVAGVIALITFIAFGLGRATAPKPPKAPLIVEELAAGSVIPTLSEPAAQPVSEEGSDIAAVPVTEGKVVASKNGERYHLPSCPSAKRIKPENIIWFESTAEAEASGYTPAKNCPGLR